MTSSAPARTTWAIDPVHTTAEFRVKHLGIGIFRGRFSRLSGTANFDEADLAGSSVEVTIPVSSLEVPGERFLGHLMTGDFFDAERSPELTFRSTSVEDVAGDRFTLVGDLSIKGVTRPVRFAGRYLGRAKHPFAAREHAAFSATATIRRADFGMTWNAPLESGGVYVGEEVTIALEVEIARDLEQASA